MKDKIGISVKMPKIEELNLKVSDDIGGHLYEEHKQAFDLLAGRANGPKIINDEEAEYILYCLQDIVNFIPASQEFMRNVKRKFPDKQANFTIQNYLTWHFVDAILLSYFRNQERLAKFKECAVTELDMIFVDELEKMLTYTADYSIDEIRYNYLIDVIPKILPYMHFYRCSKSETEKSLDRIVESKNGANKVPIEALHASLFVFQRNMLMRMHVENVLAARKSSYGASPYALNEQQCGNILYKGYKGLIKPLAKGPITIKDIKHIDDVSGYFENRRNAYNLLATSNELKGAYIGDTLIGIMGVTDSDVITNIHIDGDYRLKGAAKALINSFLENREFLVIIPVGDAIDFINKVGKYSKKLNKGIITKSTLNREEYDKKDISNLKIVDSDEQALDVVSNQFKDYLAKNYSNNTLSVKNAILDNKVVGHLIYDKKEKVIAVIEVDPEYRRSGVGSALLKSIIDFNIWRTEMAATGAEFWFDKGIASGSTVYLCSSEKRLNKFARDNDIKVMVAPRMYLE